MHKIYRSLQLLNYNLKKCFNSPAIKIIENEKYVANNNEHKEWQIPSNENFVAAINCRNSDADVPEDPICKRVFTRSCETLYYTSKTISESKNILRKWNKNDEDELVPKDSELTSEYPLRDATENEKSLQNKHKSSKDRLVQYDSHTSFDYSTKNNRRSEKSFKNLPKSIEHGMIQNSSNLSFDFPLKNTRGSKKSFGYLHKIHKDRPIQNDSNTSLDYPSRNVAKGKKLLQNRVKNNEDVLIYENSETSLGCPSQNVQKCRKSLRKLYKNKEDELLCKEFEWSTTLNGNELTRKSSSISAIWNSVKQLQNKTQPKRTSVSLSEKIKIVENPKYLPEYTPSEKELEEDNLFNEPSQSFMDSPEKVEKDSKSSQDNISGCIRNVKSSNTNDRQEEMHPELEGVVWMNNEFDMRDLVSESKYLPEYTSSEKDFEEDNLFNEPSQSFMDSPEKVKKASKSSQDNISGCIRNVKSSNTGDRQEKVHPELEGVAWMNNEFDMRDLVSESNAVKNISGERDEIKGQEKIPTSLRDLNPFETNEEHFPFEKDQY